MSYKIIIEKAAKKYIQKQSTPTIRRLMTAIDFITDNPKAGELLSGHDAQYKYRCERTKVIKSLKANHNTSITRIALQSL
jgi:mRNA-degrading endonuclease RelE of RelBE toxin-antitoxin system